jgi:hypothetical protein
MQARNTTLPAADAGEWNLGMMPCFRFGCRPLLRRRRAMPAPFARRKALQAPRGSLGGIPSGVPSVG